MEFLNAVSPRAVLVRVGAGNRYRHPDPGLIGGLERAAAPAARPAPGSCSEGELNSELLHTRAVRVFIPQE